RTGGKVMLHCFGCGDAFDLRDVCGALGLTVSDLFDAPLPADRRTGPRTPRTNPTCTTTAAEEEAAAASAAACLDIGNDRI
ncbi:hypothetical protein ACUOIJ_24165, partial [Escherichia coli]